MIRVVIDTSVLVSAVISPAGPNAELFDFIVTRQLRPYLTDAVLEEYERVFQYDRLQHLDKRRIARLRTMLERVGVKVKPSGRLKVSGHEDDNRIYECAAAAKADYIVTENTRHFKKPYKFTKVITPRRLLSLLHAGEA
jgi:putative PIN family toxin of toxin-antitoxin system